MRTTETQQSEHTARGEQSLSEVCSEIAHPLQTPGDLDPLMERIGNAHLVLLGEASHGTSEYYLWRTWLSQRLIREKGFSFIAVEGDWPDCYCVNRYIKSYSECGENARDVLHGFTRWPTWMWANWEIVALTEWLRHYNADLPKEKKVGFYGLDVYSLWESLECILEFAEKQDGETLEAAKRALRCFEPFGEDGQQYAIATDAFVPTTCEEEAIDLLRALRSQPQASYTDDYEAQFAAEQNAIVVKNAEAYYRTMIQGGSASWNVRDHHMTETLERLMNFHGSEAKVIVWEHNTHIGDARATDMAGEGMVNVGQLVREHHAEKDVVLVGFGSYQGSVIAGDAWGAPMRRMTVPEAAPGSWEEALHQASAANKLLLLHEAQRGEELYEPRGHRAIGVVYRPQFERWGNYVSTVLPTRYDAFLYLDRTRALHPLHLEPHNGSEPPDTYPWNV